MMDIHVQISEARGLAPTLSKNKIKIDQGPKCQPINYESTTEMGRQIPPKYQHRNEFLYVLPKAQEIKQELTCVIISTTHDFCTANKQ
jgi:hypothetical protein